MCKNLGERDHLGDLGADLRKKYFMKMDLEEIL
jgi:hypothetical protein